MENDFSYFFKKLRIFCATWAIDQFVFELIVNS